MPEGKLRYTKVSELDPEVEINRLAEIKRKKAEFLDKIEKEENEVRTKLKAFFDRSPGLRSLESATHILTRVKGNRVNLSQESVLEVYGKKHLDDLLLDLRKAGKVIEFDSLRLTKKRARKEDA